MMCKTGSDTITDMRKDGCETRWILKGHCNALCIFEVLCTDLDEVVQNLFTGGPHVIPLYVPVFTQHTIPMEEICICPSAIQIHNEKDCH
jgi:hypothetical protein